MSSLPATLRSLRHLHPHPLSLLLLLLQLLLVLLRWETSIGRLYSKVNKPSSKPSRWHSIAHPRSSSSSKCGRFRTSAIVSTFSCSVAECKLHSRLSENICKVQCCHSVWLANRSRLTRSAVVENALEKLRTDARLARFLELVLATINFINNPTKKMKGMQLVTIKTVCSASDRVSYRVIAYLSLVAVVGFSAVGQCKNSR